MGPRWWPWALDAWAYERGVELAFTRRAKPVDNCYVESFHDKFRDECLSTHWFLDLADARRIVSAWRDDYNTVRPHSSLGGRTPAEFAAVLHANLELEPRHPHRPNLTDSSAPPRGAGPSHRSFGRNTSARGCRTVAARRRRRRTLSCKPSST